MPVERAATTQELDAKARAELLELVHHPKALEQLRRATCYSNAANTLVLESVLKLREQGLSFAQLGEALNITRQGAAALVQRAGRAL